MAKKKAEKKKPVARKPRESEAKTKTAAAKPSEVRKMIPQEALNTLLRACKTRKSDIKELTGELGQKVSEAVERYGVNRKALGMIRTLNEMTSDDKLHKLAEVLDQFEYMLDVSGIADKVAKVKRLPLGDNDKIDAAKQRKAERKAGDKNGGEAKPFQALAEAGDKVVKDVAAKMGATEGEPVTAH